MEAKAKAGEEDLSMEEILHSIRKIIAEDGEEAPATAASGSVAASDVLELSDMVEEVAAPPATEAPAPANAQDAVNDILSALDQAVVAEAPPAPPTPPAPVVQATSPAVSASDQAYINSLLSSEAASAAATAFKKALPMDAPIRTTPSMPLRGGNTVEDLVMEALRPMLKSWLDANLANIVEKLVEREVRKLAH